MDLVRLKYRIVGLMRKSEVFPTLADSGLLEGYKGRLLDAGCGLGRNFEALEKSGSEFQYFGLDAWEPALRSAIERGSRASYMVANAADIPLRFDTFDVVLSDRVIEHTRQYKKMLKEIYRVLKPSGVLILATPNLDRPVNQFVKYILRKKPMLRWENWHGQDERLFRGHTQEFTEKELLGLLDSTGFKMVRVTGDYPSISFQGNAVWMAYRALEYLFWIMMSVLGKRTSKNIHAVVRK